MQQLHTLIDWQEKLCARRIASAVLVWKINILLPASASIHGFVAHEKGKKAKVYVLVMDKKHHQENANKAEFGLDLRDGRKTRGYKIVGELAVGDLREGDGVEFRDWDREGVGLYGSMVGGMRG